MNSIECVIRYVEFIIKLFAEVDDNAIPWCLPFIILTSSIKFFDRLVKLPGLWAFPSIESYFESLNFLILEI